MEPPKQLCAKALKYRRKIEEQHGKPWDQIEHKRGRKPTGLKPRDPEEIRRKARERYDRIRNGDPEKYEKYLAGRREYGRRYQELKKMSQSRETM